MCCAPPRRSSVAEAEDVRARRALLLPEALHDELEVRRLDPRRVVRAFDRTRARPARARSDRSPTSSRTRSISSGSIADDEARRAPRSARADRTIAARADWRSSRSSRSVLAKSPGTRPVKRSSFASESSRSETSTLIRERRPSAPREAPRRTIPARRRRRGRGSTPRPGRGRGRRRGPACARHERLERPTVRSELRPALRATASASATVGSSLQLEKTTTSGLLGKRAERARDRGAQERRLPDAARAVQHRQPRGDEVRDDDLASHARGRRTAARRARSPRRR